MAEDEDRIEQAVFSYVADASGLEDENKALRENMAALEREVEKFKRAPLIVCEVRDIVEGKAIARLPNGNEFLVEIGNDCKDLKPGDSALAEQKNLTLVRIVPISKKFDVEKFVVMEKPNIQWSQVGGLDKQRRELVEVIELPLKKPQLFKKIGITPPRGVLLYGPPGTGKTLLAKAVAASTNSTFIEVVGSELVQKFIGEGAKLVKEIFQLAREKSPSIVFIDEMDAIAATRVDVGTSGEREVQRTFMQLLAEIDGFEPLGNVKIIGCTNRRDILDPAVTRPGRLDRLLYVPLPDAVGRMEIFKIHTGAMTLDKNIDSDMLVKEMDMFSGAEIQAVCTEAGYEAIRTNRTKIKMADLRAGIIKVREEKNLEGDDYLKMFG